MYGKFTQFQRQLETGWRVWYQPGGGNNSPITTAMHRKNFPENFSRKVACFAKTVRREFSRDLDIFSPLMTSWLCEEGWFPC